MAAKTEDKPDDLVKMHSQGSEFRAIGALKGDGVFESGILVMDWSWDVGRNTLKLPLEECTSRISKDYEGSLGEDKERSEVSDYKSMRN